MYLKAKRLLEKSSPSVLCFGSPWGEVLHLGEKLGCCPEASGLGDALGTLSGLGLHRDPLGSVLTVGPSSTVL